MPNIIMHVTVNEFFNEIDGRFWAICVVPVNFDSERTILQYSQNVKQVSGRRDHFIFSGNYQTSDTQRNRIIDMYYGGKFQKYDTGDFD